MPLQFTSLLARLSRGFRTAIPAFVFLFASVVPLSAGFIPFFSDKSITPERYTLKEEQIQAYNEQAIELFEEGNFKEAQELWEKAIQIMETDAPSEWTGPFPVPADKPVDYEKDVSIGDDMSPLEQSEQLYKAAVAAFKRQKYVAAKKMFDQIEARVPDYKATRNYLTILEHKIKQAQQALVLDNKKEDLLARQEERGEWKRILEESDLQLQKKLTHQAAGLYEEALQLYKSRKFSLAKDYFLEVDNIMPEYKDTNKYLARIRDDIRREEELRLEEENKLKLLARKKEQEESQKIIEESDRLLEEKMKQQAEPLYQEGVQYYKKRQFEFAKNRFNEVEQIFPGYKAVGNYLERIDADIRKETEMRELQRVRQLERKKQEEEIARKRAEEHLAQLKKAEEEERLRNFQKEVAMRRKEREEWLRMLEESEQEHHRRLEKQAEYVYNDALGHYKQREFELARADFMEVEKIFPDFKSTKNYLSRIEQDLQERERERLAQKERNIQQKMREERLAEMELRTEEEQFRAIEDERRRKEYAEKADARKKQREEWDRILAKNERERQKRLETEAKFIYDEAMKAYHSKEWERARDGFLEAQQIIPGYKGSEKYLAKIDRQIEEKIRVNRIAMSESTENQRQKDQELREREQKRIAARIETDQRKLRLKSEKQAQAVYQFALSLYKRGNYRDAKDKFLETQELYPRYKSTEKFLKRIDQDIAEAQKQYQEDQRIAFQRQIREQRIALREQAENYEKKSENEEKRQREIAKSEAITRRQERDEWERTMRAIEQDNEKRLRDQAESIYQEALRYYKAGWFEQAKEAFTEAQDTVPGYKSAAKYIARSESNISREAEIRRENEQEIQDYRQKEESLDTHHIVRDAEWQHKNKQRQEAAFHYQRGIQAYKDGRLEEARMAFIEVEKISPGFKSAEKYLTRLAEDYRRQDDRLHAQKQSVMAPKAKQGLPDGQGPFALEMNGERSVQKAEAERQRAISAQAEKIYREAHNLYNTENFSEAKLKFIELESFSPGYKATLGYLKNIDDKIARQYRQQGQGPSQAASKLMPDRKEDVLGLNDRNALVARALKKAEEEIGQRQKSADIHKSQEQLKRSHPFFGGKTSVTGKKLSLKERRAELKNQRRVFNRKYEKEFRQMYDRAVALYRSGAYTESKSLFAQIEEMKPGYKRAAAYLKKAEAKINREGDKEPERSVVRSPRMKSREEVVGEALDILERQL